jgi:hypothetical protein
MRTRRRYVFHVVIEADTSLTDAEKAYLEEKFRLAILE